MKTKTKMSQRTTEIVFKDVGYKGPKLLACREPVGHGREQIESEVKRAPKINEDLCLFIYPYRIIIRSEGKMNVVG